MNITLKGEKDDCCLTLEGEMTYRFSRDIENRIIDSMRNHEHLKVDLSGVSAIDRCGVHLLGVLHSFGDEAVKIIAASPVVKEALSEWRCSRGKRNRLPHLLGIDPHRHVA